MEYVLSKYLDCWQFLQLTHGIYENKKVWGKCTPYQEKTELFTNLEVSTRPTTREYQSLWKALNCPKYKKSCIALSPHPLALSGFWVHVRFLFQGSEYCFLLWADVDSKPLKCKMTENQNNWLIASLRQANSISAMFRTRKSSKQ